MYLFAFRYGRALPWKLQPYNGAPCLRWEYREMYCRPATSAPWAQDAYGKYRPCAKKHEDRTKQSPIVEKFAKSGKQHTTMSGSIGGKAHCKERMGFLMELEQVRGARPELFTADLLFGAFGEMNSHYISQIEEGERKVTRVVAGSVVQLEFPRIGLKIGDGRGPRRGYPATFLTRRPAGLRLSRIIPKIEEKTPNAA